MRWSPCRPGNRAISDTARRWPPGSAYELADPAEDEGFRQAARNYVAEVINEYKEKGLNVDLMQDAFYSRARAHEVTAEPGHMR
jgi:hypothetical protein